MAARLVLNAARPFISTDLEQISVVWLNNTEDEIQHTGIKDALMENQQRILRRNIKGITGS